MNTEKSTRVKILDADYDEGRDIAKLKIKEIETEREITWALSGEDFDSLICQITKKSFSFSPAQKKVLCENIKGKEFNNIVKVDLEGHSPKDIKDENKLREFNTTLDKYPYQEIIESITEEEND